MNNSIESTIYRSRYNPVRVNGVGTRWTGRRDYEFPNIVWMILRFLYEYRINNGGLVTIELLATNAQTLQRISLIRSLRLIRAP